MRAILCVIDLKEECLPVMEVSAKMALASGATLTVLFPFRLIESGYNGNVTSLKTYLEKKAAEKFENLRRRVPALDRLNYQFRTDVGFVGDSIHSSVRENKQEMIVMGQQMAIALEANGSSLYELISDSGLPFLIVPETTGSEVLSR